MKKVCRLASRTVATGSETEDVVFYLAEADTMDGALELARFPKGVLSASPGLFDRLLEAFQHSLSDLIEEWAGVRPSHWNRQEPLEPPEGKA